jgi:hypothetical protein
VNFSMLQLMNNLRASLGQCSWLWRRRNDKIVDVSVKQDKSFEHLEVQLVCNTAGQLPRREDKNE